MNELNRIAGAVYGQAVGDALGMPSELWPRERVQSFFGSITDFLDGPAENNAACYFTRGQFTDDTSMALAVADAVIEKNGQIDPGLIGRNILSWAERIDAFSKNILGPTSKIALNAIRDGISLDELENNGLTNGAAMRIAPIATILSSSCQDTFIEEVYQLGYATHKSDVALAGAVAVGWAVTRAVEGVDWETIKQELPAIADKAQKRKVTTFSPSMASRIKLGLKLVADSESEQEASEKIYGILGAGTSTIESVPAALAMVELAKTDPNTCALLCANLGGDTDTIGAMATAICGALQGVDAINPNYLETISRCNEVKLDSYVPQLQQLRIQRRG
ncbi:ADP-ribosylglycohydrolase [Pseudovibrio sp. W64]|uniref:ADP-ribosylglycohydrolase family protein n=1 Tax=Pseudovibrio sp. W64 TaxID=1735583 RepID=UPI0007AE461B|nr:ADP-ribosylglycohydrolase family protein [Pseudovibrio sp. W64]KZK79010.1 ADP-ribosylglycohydrolase [Pseudovibrio sp. W64]